MKLINTDGKEYTTEDLLNSGYIKVGSKTYCEYWKKGDVIETFAIFETANTFQVDMYTEALNENQHRINKNRLKKIHRLKRENRTLSDRRKGCYFEIQEQLSRFNDVGNLNSASIYSCRINKLSEQIGKNSVKIQRLRTLISQSKN